MGNPSAQVAADDDLEHWLKEQHADKYLAALQKLGFERVDELDEEDIDRVVDGKNDPGVSKRLKKALARRKADQAAKEKKRNEREPVKIPALPAGTTFDVAGKEATLPDGKQVAIEFPEHLPEPSDPNKVISPAELTTADWVVIAKNAEILRGWDMREKKPEKASRTALVWKMPPDLDFVECKFLEAEETVDLAYTEETAKFVSAGFDSESASAGYFYAAASFERSHKETRTRSSAVRDVHVVAKWFSPMAKLFLRQCTEPSQPFVERVKKALAARDPAAALNKVFAEFGHVIALKVTVGGVLSFDKQEKSVAYADDSKVETSYKGALSFSVGPASGSAGATYQTYEGKTVTAAQLLSSLKWSAIGGNKNLMKDPGAWKLSLIPKLWAAVALEEVTPVYELLDEDLAAKVKQVWDTYWTRTHPAFEAPIECYWADGTAATEKANTPGFVVAMRDVVHDGDRGSVLLASGPGTSPDEGVAKTAVGAAYAHKYTKGDVWFQGASVCLPVRNGANYRADFQATSGHPDGRLVFVPSKVAVGDWNLVPNAQAKVGEDGFLFVSIDARKAGERGTVRIFVNGKVAAGASVHFWHKNDNFMPRECLCVPVPAGSLVEIRPEPTSGVPVVSSYWMPLVDGNWRMVAAERVLAGNYTAATDVFLHGYIHAEPAQRGSVKIFMGVRDAKPYACASVHRWQKHDRWVDFSSVLVPVPKGTPYRIVYEPTSGSPALEMFATAIVPA